jgi:inorganic pyrophosphatase
MNVWHDIDAARVTPEDFLGYIEIPKGSKCKYELDKQSGLLMLDRILYTAVRYQMSYGFIPRTLGDDGDPLDILVLCDEPIAAGCLVRCYPIGAIKMIDEGKRDEKIISVPFGDPSYNSVRSMEELPQHRFIEMMHFFEIYKQIPSPAKVIVDKIIGVDETYKIIEESIENYKSMVKEK